MHLLTQIHKCDRYFINLKPMHRHINESLSQSGKVAFNAGQVSFKTNTANSILQHLAWQYNDKYMGVLKTFDDLAGKKIIAHKVSNISNNGTPLIFKGVEDAEELMLQHKAYPILKMSYLYEEREEMSKLVDEQDIEFIVLLYNGSWYKATKKDNKQLFELFDDLDFINSYTSTDLPTVKLPRIISPLTSVQNAKNALKNYAKEYKLDDFIVSSFKLSQPISVKVISSVSAFSSFAPDINEFMIENTITLEKDVEVAYVNDRNNERIILFYDSKWHLISNDAYYKAMTTEYRNIFIDYIQNSNKAAELNKDLSVDNIYANIVRLRTVCLLNNVQKELTHCGYYYCQTPSFSIKNYAKYSINDEGFMSKIVTTGKTLTLFKDSIVTFVVNLKTKVAMLMLPNVNDYCYIVNIDDIPELQNEFYKGPYLDTVVSISDVYFKGVIKKDF